MAGFDPSLKGLTRLATLGTVYVPSNSLPVDDNIGLIYIYIYIYILHTLVYKYIDIYPHLDIYYYKYYYIDTYRYMF